MTRKLLHISCEQERWPLARPFVISRGAKTHADVVVATISDGEGRYGRGECVPYARYGETPATVIETIRSWCPDAVSFAQLERDLPAGAARNALDCALWDYQANVSGKTVAELCKQLIPPSCETCFTIGLDAPQAMADAARAASDYKLLKLKLGCSDENDGARMKAVRAARPDARLVGDANEGWDKARVRMLLDIAADLKFEMIEQPLPAANDTSLTDFAHPVSVCADESHHTHDDIPALATRYDAINVKLDKAGGLSGALKCIEAARSHNLDIMIGCMVATSLAIAPAALLVPHATWVDLDGPAWLAADRTPGFRFHNGAIVPPVSGLWGTAT